VKLRLKRIGFSKRTIIKIFRRKSECPKSENQKSECPNFIFGNMNFLYRAFTYGNQNLPIGIIIISY
jgi:hypothetical protein